MKKGLNTSFKFNLSKCIKIYSTFKILHFQMQSFNLKIYKFPLILKSKDHLSPFDLMFPLAKRKLEYTVSSQMCSLNLNQWRHYLQMHLNYFNKTSWRCRCSRLQWYSNKINKEKVLTKNTITPFRVATFAW